MTDSKNVHRTSLVFPDPEIKENYISIVYEGHSLDEFIESQKMDLKEWLVLNKKVKAWDGYHVTGEGKNKKSVSARRSSFAVNFVRKNPVAVKPVIQHLKIHAPIYPSYPEAIVSETGDVTLIIPDLQIGYIAHSELENRELEPMHNREAMSLVLAFIKQYGDRIKTVIFLGDVLDAAELSTYWARKPNEQRTLQLALLEAYFFLGWVRHLLPGRRIIYLEGNHEIRLQSLLVKMAPALHGIKSPSQFIELDTEDYASIPSLLSLNTIGVEYISDYPNGTFWHDDIAYIHGDIAKRSGESVQKYINQYNYSTIFGHIHRKEMAFRTIWGKQDFPEEIFSMSPGGLCNNNGSVPARKSKNNWQLGFGLVSKIEGLFAVPQILSIYMGSITFDGQVIVAKDFPYEEEFYKFLDQPEVYKIFVNKTD